MWSRRKVEPAGLRQWLGDRCFICELVAGTQGFEHYIFLDDGNAIAFLNAYPTLFGQSIVAPREHREHVTGDFAPDEYLALQAVVHRVGEALRAVVPTERLYVASFGSQQANRHVHWHVAPLPPRVPLERQQLAALDWEPDGVLEIPNDELEALAARLRAELS